MKIPDVAANPLADVISLNGRSAIVTGGAMGLGKASARRLAEAGAAVTIADIDAEAARRTAEEIVGANGASVRAVHLDVTDDRSIAAVLDEAVSNFGGLDILINNAGIPSSARAPDIDGDDWDMVMAVNLRGAMIAAREASRRMIAADVGGVIVNIASLAGMRGMPTQATYGASKAGVIALTQHMSVDLAPYGIRVLAIAPGVTLTENKMQIAEMDPEVARATGLPGMTGSALGRHGVADDIARVVLFCASDMSLFMTGTTLVVDGGAMP